MKNLVKCRTPMSYHDITDIPLTFEEDDEFITKMKEIVQDAKSECERKGWEMVGSPWIQSENYGYDGGVDFYIGFCRKETKKEKENRLKREKINKKLALIAKDRKLKRELKTYERLKKKFEKEV